MSKPLRRCGYYKKKYNPNMKRRQREDDDINVEIQKRELRVIDNRRVDLHHHHSSSLIHNTLQNLPWLVADIGSNEGLKQLEATKQIRRLLSTESSPPIEEVIQSGVVPHFVEYLKREDFPQLQFEAAWALTNIASGTLDYTKVVIDHGAIPILVKLLHPPTNDVCEQAVWALGNIASNSPECRDIVLSHGALFPMTVLLNENAKVSSQRNIAWALLNFCRGNPKPVFKEVRDALPLLGRLIYSDDEGVLRDACWTLSYLSADGSTDEIDAITKAAGVCEQLVELFRNRSTSVIIPALRTVGNIVTGDDAQTQCIISSGALTYLISMLNHPNKSIKKEACWTISNIVIGKREQKQAVMNAGLIGYLVNLLRTAEFDIQKEAAWAISNATSDATIGQIMYLANQDFIKPLCDLLVCSDPTILSICVEALARILIVGEVYSTRNGCVNLYRKLVDEADGFTKIESLQRHDNWEIAYTAKRMVDVYWLGLIYFC